MTEKTNSRQAIVDAAAELIRTHGVQGTSIARLVAKSGTSAGAIYHHFADKNAVVVAVARATIAGPLAALNAYRNRPASPAELASYAMTALALAPELGDLLAQLGAGAGLDDELGQQLRAEFAALRDSLEQTMLAWAAVNDVKAERVRGYSQLLAGLTLGYASQRVLMDGFDEAAYRGQAVELLKLPESN
ncbi:MAG: helix-turn-helix domain-containing protein [Acidobacteriota bacterium]|nr:helix-turn-helix domain-containing protein [Acidobacteriota bacterium]NLH70250.1 TetR/AcrR family transcriptional regulator [Brooklawnia sp.]